MSMKIRIFTLHNIFYMETQVVGVKPQNHFLNKFDLEITVVNKFNTTLPATTGRGYNPLGFVNYN